MQDFLSQGRIWSFNHCLKYQSICDAWWMNMLRQRTIRHSTTTVGIGLHSGLKVRLTLRPAAPNTGIVFHRTDLTPQVTIPVSAEAIGETMLASTLVQDGVRISTIEHLMSACCGLGIDNLHIDVSSEEIPIMDGSASTFVFLLQQAGIKEQDAPKKYIRLKKSIEISDGEGANLKWARLDPYHGFKLEFSIEFNHPAIDATHQHAIVDFGKDSYVKDVCRARTFGFVKDVELLRSMGLARGGSLENAIVMDEYHILNPYGLRFEDEFVRHKILDAIGDLYNIGLPMLASYTAYKSGHALNNQLIRALLAQPEAFEVVTFDHENDAPVYLVEQSHLEWMPA